MCGICGIVHLDPDRDARPDMVRRMTGRLLHRGPDDEGYFVEGAVALGMRRLSIIDLALGRQPVYNEDQSVVTVYNGEIYNFKELRAILVKKGHLLRTMCDTEVLVHLLSLIHI